MKKILFLSFSMIIMFLYPINAAIDVMVQGSIHAEIKSEPGDLLQAGTRLKLYSELSKTGFSGVKVRMIGFNQKVGYLNTFDTTSKLFLDNLVDWVEVELNGNLFPQGPPMKLSIGNVEIDYSPYIISLKDDALSDYHSSYINHRGISFNDLSYKGIEASGFVLWGFNDPLKNTIGGKVSKEFSTLSLTGIVSDYRYRTADAEEKIKNMFKMNSTLAFELESEHVVGFEIKQDFGRFATLRYFHASQNKNTFQRNEGLVERINQVSVLQEAELEFPVAKGLDLTFGFRDVPIDFDPIFRDRTPEFDPTTGHYLGYNLIDRYYDRVGVYSKLNAEKEGFQLSIKLADMKNHAELSTRYSMAEFAFAGEILTWQIDIFSSFEQESSFLNTGIRNSSENGFSRYTFTKPVKMGNTPLFIGSEIRKNISPLEDFSLGTLFVRYEKADLLVLDAGIRQRITGDIIAGNYIGLKYKAPNGLMFRLRRTFPTVESNGKELYDPDYRLREPNNIAEVSINVTF